METMTKGEFARECNVTPARVSQWLAEGKIGKDCLIGEGRNARILVERAKAQIGLRRDLSQAMGNGLKTQLDLSGAAADPEGSAPPPTDPLKRDDVAHLIQIERLEAERRRNRREKLEEQQRLGQLVPADDVRAQMGRLAVRIDEANDAMLTDFAASIAARFEIPQRDVLHELRKVRAHKKADEAQRARARAAALPETVEIVVIEEVDA